jgi:tRNA/rRNA methyltransferase
VRLVKPSIVLVKPQLPENIGLVARAMDNCGLKNLIIINPKKKWLHKKTIHASANSKSIIYKAKIYDSVDEALLDFNFVVAMSARKRFLQKPFQNNINLLFNQFPVSKKTAIMFGPENSGLSNNDLKLVDLIFNINTSKSNPSLNLSHAVLLIAFAWREFFYLRKQQPKNNLLNNKKALKKDFYYFMDFLKKELDEVGFLYPKAKAKSMIENIETMFIRASLSKIEIQTLWGMIKKLRK